MASTKIFLLSTLIIAGGIIGCNDSNPTKDKSNAQKGNNESSKKGIDKKDSQTAGVAKIVVTKDGKIFVNSASTSVDDLLTKLDGISGLKEIWYFREDPTAAEPHPNAIETIKVIASKKLPIAMYLDKDFTTRLGQTD